MKQLSAILLVITSVLPAFAQETKSDYEFFGFSNDLKIAALETFNEAPTEDMSASTKFIFVDVDKNAYATNTVKYNGKAGENIKEVRKQGRALAQLNFTKFNVSGKNTGTLINLKVELEENTEKLIFRANNMIYTLTLKSVPTGEMLFDSFEKKKMDMSVVHDGQTQILQRDKEVPASRGFAVNYTIKAVYLIDNKIAVIVEYGVAPGFEGSMDTYDMLVTGVLK